MTYTLSGEPLDPAKDNYVMLTLNYLDADGAIDWESADYTDFVNFRQHGLKFIQSLQLFFHRHFGGVQRL